VFGKDEKRKTKTTSPGEGKPPSKVRLTQSAESGGFDQIAACRSTRREAPGSEKGGKGKTNILEADFDLWARFWQIEDMVRSSCSDHRGLSNGKERGKRKKEVKNRQANHQSESSFRDLAAGKESVPGN